MNLSLSLTLSLSLSLSLSLQSPSQLLNIIDVMFNQHVLVYYKQFLRLIIMQWISKTESLCSLGARWKAHFNVFCNITHNLNFALWSHAHKATVMELKWNKNGNWLLTASRDHLLKVFDIRNMKEEIQTFKGHKKEATGRWNHQMIFKRLPEPINTAVGLLIWQHERSSSLVHVLLNQS